MNRALWVVLSCCLVSYSPAAERHVPEEYATIQQAIDATQDGDAVIVQPGTYHESIRFKGKAITVRAADISSWDAVQKTVIAGWKTKAGCVVFEQGETHESVLDGFTLWAGQDGSWVSSPAGQFQAGGGVLCVNSSPTIRRCFITDNQSHYGGGIAMFGACQARVVSCLLTGNWADKLGGAILIRRDVAVPTGGPASRSRSLSIAESPSIEGAVADCGPAIVNCTIADNYAGSAAMYAYDVDCWDTRPVILNTIVYGLDHGLLISDLSCVSHCCIKETHLFKGDYASSMAVVDTSSIPDSIGGFPGFVKMPSGEPTFDNWGDEYHLEMTSPCVNAGSPAAAEYVGYDLDGQSRVMAGRIDIGADEARPELAVTSPSPGDIWAAGSARTVRWNGLLYEGTVDLLFSVDAGGNRLVLAQTLPNTGSYRWEVPGALDSNSCVVYVVPHGADANVLQVNSGRFTIHPDSPGPAVASNWLSLGGNFRRSGLSDSQGPDGGQVKWRFDTAGAVVASVTVGFDGRVHIACEDGSLHTLSAEGRLLWTCAMDSAAVSSPTLGPDGSLFVGSEHGTLYAVDTSGKTRWTYRMGGAIYSSPAVASNGSVYVGSADGVIYALTDKGSELWHFQTKGPGIRTRGTIFASPTLGTDGAVYIAGLYDPNLYALDPTDGGIKWVCRFGTSGGGGPGQAGSGGRPFVSPVVAQDGTIYQVLLRDSHLYAIEPGAGRIIWSADLADPNAVGLGGQGVRLDGEAWSEPVLGPDGTIYVSTGDPYLRAVHPDGRIKWTKRLGEIGGFTLTVDRRGFIYAAAEDGVVYRVSPEGVETGRRVLSGLPGFPVVAADDLLIVADSRDYSLLVADEQNTIWAISSEASEDEP